MFYVDKNWNNISAEESSAYMLFTAYDLEYFGYLITIGKGRLISASAASSFISNTSCLRCIVRLSGIYENNGIALPAWESILEALTWTLPKKNPHTNVVRFWCSLQLLFLALSMIFRIIQVQLHFLSILFMFMTFTRETRTHHKI